VNSGQRPFYTPETGKRDRRPEIATVPQLPKQLESIHARHDQIRNDNVGAEGSKPVEGILPSDRHLRLEITVWQHRHQSTTLSHVIIDDENSAPQGWQSWHELEFYQAEGNLVVCAETGDAGLQGRLGAPRFRHLKRMP